MSSETEAPTSDAVPRKPRIAAAFARVTIPSSESDSIASGLSSNSERNRSSLSSAEARVATRSLTSSISETTWTVPSTGIVELNQRQLMSRPSRVTLRCSLIEVPLPASSSSTARSTARVSSP